MIEKTTAYKVGDKFFPVIEEAQQASLKFFSRHKTLLPDIRLRK